MLREKSARRARLSCGLAFLAFALHWPGPVSICQGDVIEYFADIAGSPDGEFGWDDFGTTGASYSGPHAPDRFGTGSLLTANAGGLISSTNNLYSFFSIPLWNVQLQDLKTTNPFTSVVVQFATSAEYGNSQFTLNGQSPDEFEYLGEGPEIGNFPVNLYWAEWQGLLSTAELVISLSGTGQHQSLTGVKASYFNTHVPYDISAIPEPGGLALLVFGPGFLFFHRRR